ncbi:MAG: hypothetical protein KAK00_01900 [Nanoarchaeota archaeon]|nr:hypothetical protein [Nanoarchaeota archaeon]
MLGIRYIIIGIILLLAAVVIHNTLNHSFSAVLIPIVLLFLIMGAVMCVNNRKKIIE